MVSVKQNLMSFCTMLPIVTSLLPLVTCFRKLLAHLEQYLYTVYAVFLIINYALFELSFPLAIN